MKEFTGGGSPSCRPMRHVPLAVKCTSSSGRLYVAVNSDRWCVQVGSGRLTEVDHSLNAAPMSTRYTSTRLWVQRVCVRASVITASLFFVFLFFCLTFLIYTQIFFKLTFFLSLFLLFPLCNALRACVCSAFRLAWCSLTSFFVCVLQFAFCLPLSFFLYHGAVCRENDTPQE